MKANLYRCHMRSTPGMWKQYHGHVDVHAHAESEVFELAVRKLARTAFPDRAGTHHWKLRRIELLKSEQPNRDRRKKECNCD